MTAESFHSASEVARQTALAGQRGLPLADGLRAAAEDASSAAVAAALRRLAAEMERGAPLEVALRGPSAGLSPPLVALLLAADRTGDLPAVLLQWLLDRRRAESCWRDVWSALAYPLLAFGCAYAIFLFNAWVLIPPFRDLLVDFEVKLPVNTHAVFQIAEHGPAISLAVLSAAAVGWLAVRLIGGAAASSRLITGLPLIGKLWWWTGAADCYRGLGLLTARGVPLPEALALAGPALSDAALGQACLAVRRRIEQGYSLAAALQVGRELPVSVAPLLHAGELRGDLPSAFAAAADLLEDRLRDQSLILAQVLPPFLILATVGIAASTLFALMAALGALIQGLT